jgi:predicted DNA-binding transcriptional regulator AlpA
LPTKQHGSELASIIAALLAGQKTPKQVLDAALAERVSQLLHADQSLPDPADFGVGHSKGPPLQEAYSPEQFCVLFAISRSSLYKAWREKRGPKFYKIGQSVRISREAAVEWIHDLEVATAQRNAVDDEAAA